MKTRFMRRIAVALGMSVCVSAACGTPLSADDAYQAPQRWNNFNVKESVKAGETETKPISLIQQVSINQVENLPAPQADVSLEIPAPEPMVGSGEEITLGECSDCQTGTCDSGCETGCASGCSVGQPQPISPWFGGFDLIFWNVACDSNMVLISDDAAVPMGYLGDVGADSGVGFDIHAGRYFACGRYALDINYMFWDPSASQRIVNDAGGGLQVTLPQTRDISINRGGGAQTVYDEYDAAGPIRMTRDLRLQGLEVNLHSFGLMGARRLGTCTPCGIFGLRGPCCNRSCGGAIGPLARSCSGRVRVQTFHGFRWFQLEDRLEIAGNVDGTPGYQATDLYYETETENNLLGYQFGSRLSYCICNRLLFNLGGKFGIYGNEATFRHRVGTTTILGYTNTQGAGAGDLNTEYSDTCLAGLGELDLGFGYRLCSCWTVRAGYRVLGAAGVATAPGVLPVNYLSAAGAGAVRANDSLLLHGAYVGADFNW